MEETRWEPHSACLLKALVLLSTLYTHKIAEHNRKKFLEILFLMVSFGLLISDLRRKSVTILILCFLFKERWWWWWSGCASRELKQVLVFRNQTNVSFFVFFFSSKVFFFICIFIHILTHKKIYSKQFLTTPSRDIQFLSVSVSHFLLSV